MKTVVLGKRLSGKPQSLAEMMKEDTDVENWVIITSPRRMKTWKKQFPQHHVISFTERTKLSQYDLLNPETGFIVDDLMVNRAFRHSAEMERLLSRGTQAKVLLSTEYLSHVPQITNFDHIKTQNVVHRDCRRMLKTHFIKDGNNSFKVPPLSSTSCVIC